MKCSICTRSGLSLPRTLHRQFFHWAASFLQGERLSAVAGPRFSRFAIHSPLTGRLRRLAYR